MGTQSSYDSRLVVSEKEEGIVALHLPIGPLKKPAPSWSRYRDVNPVPTSPLADDIALHQWGQCLLGVRKWYLYEYEFERLLHNHVALTANKFSITVIKSWKTKYFVNRERIILFNNTLYTFYL